MIYVDLTHFYNPISLKKKKPTNFENNLSSGKYNLLDLYP